MCLRPITIYNNSRVISTYYLQKGKFQVPCGECAECQQHKSLEWLYRAYWQFQEVKSSNGYALFDTLTYSDENLPHLSDFLGDSEVDFPCFSIPDIQGFFNRLRSAVRCKLHLGKTDNVPFKYFLSSEYGTKEGCTHRPHYHIIFYVYDRRLSPVDLSYLISQSWTKGRTDGAKYKGKRYILDNRVINAHSKNADTTHLHQYVTKYIEKDSEFSEVVRKRLYLYMYSRFQAENQSCNYTYDYDNMQVDSDSLPVVPSVRAIFPVEFWHWLSLPHVHSIYLKTKHLVEQFHKQSIGFGSYLIPNLDLSYLWKTGCQKFNLCKQNTTIINIPLPIYYYRKIFQEQVFIADKLSWQLTDIGKRYAALRKSQNIDKLATKMRNVFQFHNCDNYDKDTYRKIAQYVIYYRDSFGFDSHVANIEDKMQHSHLYSCQNKTKWRGRYLSRFYHDENKQFRCHLNPAIPFNYFLSFMQNKDFSWCDGYERIYQTFLDYLYTDNEGKQALFDKKQRRKKALTRQMCLF